MATKYSDLLLLLASLQVVKRRKEDEEQRQRKLLSCRRSRIARFYRQQRLQRLMFYLLFLTAMKGALRCPRSLWTKPRSSDCWERIVLQTFSDSDWRENFRMSYATYMDICNELRCRLVRHDTTMTTAITVGKKLQWRYGN